MFFPMDTAWACGDRAGNLPHKFPSFSHTPAKNSSAYCCRSVEVCHSDESRSDDGGI